MKETLHVGAGRTIAVPPDLRAALDGKPAIADRFARLSFSHRKEYISWIVEAKMPETRARRIERTLAMIEAKKPADS